MKSASVAFIGGGQWGMALLDALISNPHVRLTAILTDKTDIFAQSRAFSEAVKAMSYSTHESYQSLISEGADAIVMAGWSRKIPSSFISSVKCPFVNIHGSLLPQYRGPEPIIQQLLHDADMGGVTIHSVGHDWDSGAICVQREFTIDPQDNNRTLFLKAVRTGMKALSEFVEKLLDSSLDFQPQDENKATYYRRLNIMDFIIDESYSVADVVRISRAFVGQYPLVYRQGSQLIQLLEFRLTKETQNELPMHSLRDAFLIITKSTPCSAVGRNTGFSGALT